MYHTVSFSCPRVEGFPPLANSPVSVSRKMYTVIDDYPYRWDLVVYPKSSCKKSPAKRITILKLQRLMVFRRIRLTFISFALLSCLAAAQQSDVRARVTHAVDETNVTALKGNTHPLARPEFDLGPAPSSLPLNRMLLVLQRGPEQEIALQSLLDQQQDKGSRNYHAWLTPEEFGQRFGPADQDIQAIASWLASHRLHVDRVAKGRAIIEFSGTAEQVKEAFHAEIHKYAVHGEEHWANSSDPELPSALTPVVAGIVSLHDFPRKPLHHITGTFPQAGEMPHYEPLSPSSPGGSLFTRGTNCGLGGGPCYAVGPYDFATIYNVLPLWNSNPPIDGTGQTIAIVGQSDIYPQDVSDFHSAFGLPAPHLNIIYNGTNPGKLPTSGDEAESDLDVEWSSAIAKGATIDFVVSGSTNTSAGVDLSAEYIIDNNLAPVMSESYGACELDLGTAGNQFFSQLWQQAAAEGITVFVAAGDSGSAVCDQNAALATHGLSVSGISSTPYDVAVGGTDFDDLQNPSAYWNSTNDPVTQASAKSYVPEMTWNDSCTNSEFSQFTGDTNAESACNDTTSHFWPSFLSPIGGSGGASNCTTSASQSVSTCTGGYAKPSWQTGPGVPNDGKRYVPDVSLFAANGLNGSFYVICETDIYGGCAGGVSNLIPIGGTSGSAPAFAAIMAMVNQKTQSRQGDANYVLYPLAARPGASCNSTGTIGSSCIFYDVTTGTIAMPCVSGTPNCVTNVSGNQNGVLSGYSTTPGYDLATGLGSVNAANLVNNWSAVSFRPTVATLSLNPTTQITHGASVKLNVIVAPKTGAGTPTGSVSLLTSTKQQAGTFTLASGSVSATTGLLPGGNYTVTAHYAGDGIYAASDSSPGIPVTISPEPSTATVQAFTLDQNGNAIPFTTGPYGQSVIYLRTSVTGQSGEGVPTGNVNLTQTLNGTPVNVAGNPFALNSAGYTMTPLPGGNYQAFVAGTYALAATYSGDASFKPTTSQAVSFTVTKATTTSATSIVQCTSGTVPCVLPLGTLVTIFGTVTVHGAAITNLPTGTITFYANGTPLGPPAAVDSGIIPPVASLTTSQLPAGADNITAQYSGDANYLESTSPASLVDVGQTFTITANQTVISVASPGQSGSTTLTFAAQNGFTGSATLSPTMCSNLPSKSSCSFNPATVTFNSSTTSVPVTLTVTTTAPSSHASFANRLTPRPWPGSRQIAVVFVMGLSTVLLDTRARRRCRAIVALVALAVIASAIGCGGGGTGGGGSSNPGTPPGNYSGVTVTVTISGVTQSLNTLSVNVQ
jgi:subtilase family serine protease